MNPYHKITPYTLIFAAGLATTLPIRNDAKAVETNISHATYSPQVYTSRSPNFASQSATTQSPGMSLDRLVSGAEIILVGEVVGSRLKSTTVPDGNDRVDIPTKEIVFRVIENLKGKLRNGDPLVVTMYEPASVRVGNGEKVLWYLSPKSVYGFQAPLQLRSGYFLIKPGGELGQLTSNLDYNQGLWSESEPLWSSLNEKELARQNLLNRQIPKDSVDRMLSTGDGACCPELLPLDLLLAATHAKVASSGSAPSQR